MIKVMYSGDLTPLLRKFGDVLSVSTGDKAVPFRDATPYILSGGHLQRLSIGDVVCRRLDGSVAINTVSERVNVMADRNSATCAECGKLFVRECKAQKWCCAECRMTRVCTRCGQKFVAKSEYRTICECCKHPGGKKDIRKCIYCGVALVDAKRSQQKCDVCSKLGQRKVCRCCGKYFFGKGRYCSDECIHAIPVEHGRGNSRYTDAHLLDCSVAVGRDYDKYQERFPDEFNYCRKLGMLHKYMDCVRTDLEWDLDACRDAASKCRGRREFFIKYQSAYQSARRHGWMDTLFSEKRIKWTWSRKRRTWTYEKCKAVAIKCKGRRDFSLTDQSAYKHALYNGWLDDFFPA